jgi:hypothetical protein
MSDTDEILDRTAAAKALDISLATLGNWEHMNNFPQVKRYTAFNRHNKKKWYYTKADIQTILEWRYGLDRES